MKKISIKNKEFALSITSRQIERAVNRIADQINRDMAGKIPLFLVILNGAFIFASDLLKKVKLNCEISFVKLSSYKGTHSTEIVREVIGLDEIVKDRTVIIVEDIIDTGLTIDHMIDTLRKLEAADVRIAAMLFKPAAFQRDFKINYLGMEVSNDFIVGYGLDYDGFGRNFEDIYKIVK